ncbi:hypothetical protein E2C01_021252 [Portunus trituberculatus]|uniref:Uncharacterized protein n=1 Tax=Portunus trituberculatus TaxID=210409 RepID=A0A5B7E3Q7_PORTR|nr:hypothetical protein [Portunus trituberculatus]
MTHFHIHSADYLMTLYSFRNSFKVFSAMTRFHIHSA